MTKSTPTSARAKKPKAAAPKTTAKKTTKAADTAPASRATSKSRAATSAVKAAPKPVVVTQTAPVVGKSAMKKKELIDVVTERSGIKKKDAKPVVEAMLAVLGQAISDGRELNLQPLGKVKINRQKDVQGGKVTVLKVRQSDRASEPKDPLAEAAE